MVCVAVIVTAVYYWSKQEETLLQFSAQELYNQPQINPPLPQPALQRLELPVTVCKIISFYLRVYKTFECNDILSRVLRV